MPCAPSRYITIGHHHWPIGSPLNVVASVIRSVGGSSGQTLDYFLHYPVPVLALRAKTGVVLSY
eukprot:2145556-Alexandrium_andersonii.AAC.1